MGGNALTQAGASAGLSRLVPAYAGIVEILWWLAAPLLVTGVAVLWAIWADRPARTQVDEHEARKRLGAALARPVPERARRVAPQRAERPSGVAVRRSELTGERPTQTQPPARNW